MSISVPSIKGASSGITPRSTTSVFNVPSILVPDCSAELLISFVIPVLAIWSSSVFNSAVVVVSPVSILGSV